tara:strand:- start:1023 stop:1868 length:846 start_codon:yes stop_codon:yes gene_type:complete
MAEWFRRTSKKIKTYNKRDIGEGLWVKCPDCSEVIYKQMLESNSHICMSCSYHFRVNSSIYTKILLDEDSLQYLSENIRSKDILDFEGQKKYSDQLVHALKKAESTDAVTSMKGKINNLSVVLCVMDFSFIGGSMGSVVGERIFSAISLAEKEKLPLIIISSSGGARMQEGAISLMQLAKTTLALARYKEKGGLFISVLTDPTTGGVTASFAMLGDIIISEPNALIGFAGSRVIKQTIGEDLPEGFQRSEFLLKKGFIDHIVSRNEMKETISSLIEFLIEK